MIKKRPIRALVLGLIVITPLIQCKTIHEKGLKRELETYFEQQASNQLGGLDKEFIPGFSVIITKDDSILYIENFGSTNLNEKLPITETTIFDIASVSKQFTGMAIALLEEKGEIKMNDKITQYLPNLPAVMNDITVYQLVHHSSGIRDWPPLFVLRGWYPQEPLTLDDIYQMLKKQESLNFTTGTEFSYSNSNYNLLAKIIEAVTGAPFVSWIHDSIFAPLKMENTYFVEGDNSEKNSIANSYILSGNNYIPFSSNLGALGSSSIMSSTSDMSKWLINFHSRALGVKGTFNKMTQKGKLNNNQPIDYGYGLNIIKLKNKRAYFHDGAWGGYRSATLFFPKESIGLVILSNNGALQPKIMINDIVDILFGNERKKKIKENGNNYSALRVDNKKKEITINYNNLTGIFYSKELDIKYKIEYVNDELKIQSPIFPKDIILKHSEDLTFTSNSGLIQSISFLEENGAIISLVIDNPRAKNLLFKKVN